MEKMVKEERMDMKEVAYNRNNHNTIDGDDKCCSDTSRSEDLLYLFFPMDI